MNTSGVVSHVMYIRGPRNRVVAEETWTESGSAVTTSPVLYHHDDIVGSTVVTNTTNGTSGVTLMRYSPFGLRIDPANPSLAPPTPSAPATTPSRVPSTRIGFTGHEMEDELNLINMKGRIYDPRIARFLTPDPMVSAPYSGNGYDRYGYALNRPLNYTDASGFAIGFDPWLVQGYGEGFLDIYVGWFVGKTIQREREIRREMVRRDMLNWAGAQYAQAKKEQRNALSADVWLEGPNHDEVPLHLSIAVGDPNGDYQAFSYGILDSRFVPVGAPGAVYVDRDPGGPIVPGTYLKTSAEADAAITAWLAAMVGGPNPIAWYGSGEVYTVGNVCRDFSWGMWNIVSTSGFATAALPPNTLRESGRYGIPWWLSWIQFR